MVQYVIFIEEYRYFIPLLFLPLVVVLVDKVIFDQVECVNVAAFRNLTFVMSQPHEKSFLGRCCCPGLF